MTTSTNSLDQCICDVYVDINVPSDRLVNNDGDRQRFCNEVRQRMSQTYQDDFLTHRLITIRKKGKLPKIRR